MKNITTAHTETKKSDTVPRSYSELVGFWFGFEQRRVSDGTSLRGQSVPEFENDPVNVCTSAVGLLQKLCCIDENVKSHINMEAIHHFTENI